MLDTAMESPEDKMVRLDKDLGEANLKIQTYEKQFAELREMIFGSKRRIDIVVKLIERIGLAKYREQGVYLHPHEMGL